MLKTKGKHLITIFDTFVKGVEPPNHWGDQQAIIKAVTNNYGDSNKYKLTIKLNPWGKPDCNGKFDVLTLSIVVSLIDSFGNPIGDPVFNYVADLGYTGLDLQNYTLGEQALIVADPVYFNAVSRDLLNSK